MYLLLCTLDVSEPPRLWNSAPDLLHPASQKGQSEHLSHRNYFGCQGLKWHTAL